MDSPRRARPGHGHRPPEMLLPPAVQADSLDGGGCPRSSTLCTAGPHRARARKELTKTSAKRPGVKPHRVRANAKKKTDS